MTTIAIRRNLITTFGPRQYRITRAGDIHIYGVMPNSNVVGWYLFGYVGDRDTEKRFG